jgi:hypothetical protein
MSVPRALQSFVVSMMLRQETVGSDECTNCKAGTYSTSVASDHGSTCQLCPSLTTSPQGSFNVTQCVCQPGTFVTSEDSSGGHPCVPCRAGTYKASNGTTVRCRLVTVFAPCLITV